VAVLLGGGVAAAPIEGTAEAVARPAAADVSARDLHRMSRAEVREALRRIRERRRTR
jgi:hypothetical protein